MASLARWILRLRDADPRRRLPRRRPVHHTPKVLFNLSGETPEGLLVLVIILVVLFGLIYLEMEIERGESYRFVQF